MPLSAPQASGDIIKPADINGHILVAIPIKFEPHVPNVNTKPGEQSPAIRVNVADFSDLQPDGQPAIYNGGLWFNAMLHGSLKRQIGESVFGMMAVGTASPGKNAPFQLIAVEDAAWVAFVSEWIDSPAGVAFEAAAKKEIASDGGISTPIPPVGSAIPGAPSAPPAPQTTNRPPAAPAAAPPAAPAAPVAAPPQNQMAQFAGLPAEEQAKIAAILAAQSGASS